MSSLRRMLIREICPEDMIRYRNLCMQLDKETTFRLYEAGERTEDPVDYRAEISRFLENPQSTIIVTEEESGALTGYLQAIGRTPRRIRHVVSVNIGILQRCAGQGLGGRMFAYLEEWSGRHNVRRIDLTVMENNFIARKLYMRQGFEEEGVKKKSMLVDGIYVNEIFMSKIL